MTYSFECKDCGEKFNVEKGINEEVEVRCTECSGDNVKRVFKSTGVIWKTDGAFGKSK